MASLISEYVAYLNHTSIRFVFKIAETGDGQVGFNRRMWLVTFERYMLGTEIIQSLHIVGNRNNWKHFWFPAELLLRSGEMIFIDVHISEGVYKLADFATQDLCHDMGEERVACDVEGDAEEDVGATLVELERDLLVLDVELIHVVADGEVVDLFGLGHRVEILRIP